MPISILYLCTKITNYGFGIFQILILFKKIKCLPGSGPASGITANISFRVVANSLTLTVHRILYGP